MAGETGRSSRRDAPFQDRSGGRWHRVERGNFKDVAMWGKGDHQKMGEGRRELAGGDDDDDTELSTPMSLCSSGTCATCHSGEHLKATDMVDVMQTSWLLASVGSRRRCAAKRQTLDSPSCIDVRRLLQDVVFSLRGGCEYNLHGHRPSSPSRHEEQVQARLGREPARVSKILKALRSDMLLPAVRCLGYILTKTWRLLFDGLHVDAGSLRGLQEALEQADDGTCVVFCPTHKTHLDYLIVSYLCFGYGIPLPRIAAGNNLDLPLVGRFLRANGSFFMRRSFRDDQLYKDVLDTYVHELMADGNPIEVFLEGGRSRSGRVHQLRMGFLSLLQRYLPTSNENARGRKMLLVPISLDYDKVLEVEDYAAQVLGKPKAPETLLGLLKSIWSIFFLRCGHAYVRFGQPLALDARFNLLETAKTLGVRMQETGTITSTSVVSSVLMWRRAYATKDMIHSSCQWLLQELEERQVNVSNVSSDEVVDHALSVLKVPVQSNGVVQSHLGSPTQALVLNFYRNQLLHAFLPDMAIVTAIHSILLQRHLPDHVSTIFTQDQVSISTSSLLHKASSFWTYLRHLCHHQDVDLADRLEQLQTHCPDVFGNAYSSHSFVLVRLNKWRKSRLVSFILALSWPLVDSLWLCLQSLRPMASHSIDNMSVGDLVRQTQLLAKALLSSHQLQHAEALCSETMKQAVEYLLERGILRYVAAAKHDVAMVQLGAHLTEQELEKVVAQVCGMRRSSTHIWKPLGLPMHVEKHETLHLMHPRGAHQPLYESWMARPSV